MRSCIIKAAKENRLQLQYHAQHTLPAFFWFSSAMNSVSHSISFDADLIEFPSVSQSLVCVDLGTNTALHFRAVCHQEISWFSPLQLTDCPSDSSGWWWLWCLRQSWLGLHVLCKRPSTNKYVFPIGSLGKIAIPLIPTIFDCGRDTKQLLACITSLEKLLQAVDPTLDLNNLPDPNCFILNPSLPSQSSATFAFQLQPSLAETSTQEASSH